MITVFAFYKQVFFYYHSFRPYHVQSRGKKKKEQILKENFQRTIENFLQLLKMCPVLLIIQYRILSFVPKVKEKVKMQLQSVKTSLDEFIGKLG